MLRQITLTVDLNDEEMADLNILAEKYWDDLDAYFRGVMILLEKSYKTSLGVVNK